MPTQARPYEFAPAIRRQAEQLRVTSYREAIRGSIALHSITADKIAVGVLNVGSGAVTIDNGAITAAKLNVTSLDAITGTMGSLTAGDITATDIHGGTISGTALSGGTISGYDITGGNVTGSNVTGVAVTGSAITGGTIDGSTITGAVIRTAVTNERMVVDTNDMRMYDSNNHTGLQIDWSRSEGVALNFFYRRSWSYNPGLKWVDEDNGSLEFAYLSGDYTNSTSKYAVGMVSHNGTAIAFNDGTEQCFAKNASGDTNLMIDANGWMWATKFQPYSDERLKEAIKPLATSLDHVRKLKPIRYRMRGQRREQAGFSAQDVARVLPMAVAGVESPVHPGTGEREWEGERLGIDMMALLGLAVGGIQELADRVEALERRGEPL